LRPQHAGRNNRGDGVGGVVQSVEKIEQQRDGDQSDQDGESERGIHGAILTYCPESDVRFILLRLP